MDAAALPVTAGSRRGPRALLRAASDDRLVARLARVTTRPSRSSTTATTVTCSPSAATCSAAARRPRTRSSSCSSRCIATCAPMIAPSASALALRRRTQPLPLGPARAPRGGRARRRARALDRRPRRRDEVERRQDLKALLADLGGLPDEQRAALLSPSSAASRTTTSPRCSRSAEAKVKALVFQARESLSSARSAREADCREIREQLATLRGAALRRATLRRHVATCPGCAAFNADVKRQRRRSR